MLKLPNDKYTTYTRWGRVGERGQTKDYHAIKTCISVFQTKFKEKIGNQWEQHSTAPAKPKKYTLLEIHYDDEEQEQDDNTLAGQQASEAGENTAPVKSQLLAETQRLLELILNETCFQAVLNDIGYDSSKTPLGRLGKTTVTRGYQLLKELAEEIDKESPDRDVSLRYCVNDAVITYALHNLDTRRSVKPILHMHPSRLWSTKRRVHD